MALDDYRFHGMHAEGRGIDLRSALDQLSDFWNSRPSLVMHSWGVLTLELTIGGSTATIQIADKRILDDLEVGNIQSLIDKFAADMQMDRADVELLLSESTDVVAVVDRIRPITGPQWSPDAGTSSPLVLPQVAPHWMRGLSKDVDAETRRARGAPRTRRGKRLLNMVVRSGIARGVSNKKLAIQTGLPQSTISDTRDRIMRERKRSPLFRNRIPGQRLTDAQKQEIVETLEEHGGNAAAVARELGVSARTVRDLRIRAVKKPERIPHRVRSRWSSSTRDKLIDLVSSGITPTEAGRRLGVPGRTARGWVSRSNK